MDYHMEVTMTHQPGTVPVPLDILFTLRDSQNPDEPSEIRDTINSLLYPNYADLDGDYFGYWGFTTAGTEKLEVIIVGQGATPDQLNVVIPEKNMVYTREIETVTVDLTRKPAWGSKK